MVHRKVGDAGRTLVVEERLEGPEVSFFASPTAIAPCR